METTCDVSSSSSGLLSSTMSEKEMHTDTEEDYRFLHSMLVEKKLHLLFKIHERLKCFEKQSPVPDQERIESLAWNLFKEPMSQDWRDEVKELAALLSKPHFQSLLCVHDAIAQRDFDPSLPPAPDDASEEEDGAFKIVSLVKTKEPLGMTIRRNETTGAVVVARILRGGAADKSDLIHEGDELKEVNGVLLKNRKPEEILSILAQSPDSVTFTIIPAFAEESTSSCERKPFVRALFDYNPHRDPAVPCRDAALSFKRGEILQIVCMEDVNWWQACHLKDSSGRGGLIPSQQLQERRVALQRPRALFKPGEVKAPDDNEAGLRSSFRLGKKSTWFRERDPSKRWSGEVNGPCLPPTYVEVIPHRRDAKNRQRLVVLAGPNDVGLNELKKRLLLSDPDRFGVSVSHTTRKKKSTESEGKDYHFVSVNTFEEHILNRRFIEYWRYKDHYYGTSLDSILEVIAEGKVCLLNVHPSKIGHVYTCGFKPYVVFVKPPCIEELRLTRRRAKFIRDKEDTTPTHIFAEEDFKDMIHMAEIMENQHGHLFDKVIVNGDMAVGLRELKADIERMLKAEVQWIPAETKRGWI